MASAAELRRSLENVTTRLSVARTLVMNARLNAQDQRTALAMLQTDAMDVQIAIQGLTKIIDDLEATAGDFDRTQRDVDNYRWSI